MCLPYLRNNAFQLVACNYNGIIYIQEVPEDNSSAKEMDLTQQKFCYSGFKFEALSTLSISGEELQQYTKEDQKALLDERPRAVVNNKEEYGIVVQSKLNHLGLIMGAEVDCAERKFSSDEVQKPYLELKTTKIITNSMEENSFERYKLIKFWAQSFLVGIPKIIIAYRDNNLKVEKVGKLATLKIPHLVRQHHQERQQKIRVEQSQAAAQDLKHGANFLRSKYSYEPWNANVCLAFAEDFLTWLKREVLHTSDPTLSYTLTFSPSTHKNGILVKNNGPQSGFLPEWWIH